MRYLALLLVCIMLTGWVDPPGQAQLDVIDCTVIDQRVTAYPVHPYGVLYDIHIYCLSEEQ